MELGPGGEAGRAAGAPCWQAGDMATKPTGLVGSLASFLLADFPSDSNSENRRLRSKEFTLGKNSTCLCVHKRNK